MDVLRSVARGETLRSYARTLISAWYPAERRWMQHHGLCARVQLAAHGVAVVHGSYPRNHSCCSGCSRSKFSRRMARTTTYVLFSPLSNTPKSHRGPFACLVLADGMVVVLRRCVGRCPLNIPAHFPNRQYSSLPQSPIFLPSLTGSQGSPNACAIFGPLLTISYTS